MIDGLRTKEGQPVPLLGVHVQAEVVGGHTRVKVRQRYKNAEAKPIEAVYVFPLPSDATVCGFTMICEGRRLEGVVQEREEAFRNYDEAITQGHGAALLEQERKNVFTASIGNLLPHEETLIEVEYLQRLTADEGALRWMLPTLVAPRYIPGTPQGNRTGGGWADPTSAVPDADRITPTISEVQYGLKLELVFDLGVEVNVESPSHRIITTKAEGRTKVSFEQVEVALDRDVVIIARGAKGTIAGVTAHREDEQPGFFALTVVPDLFEAGKAAAPQDVVFLIDTSGSMEGESLPQAKAALKLCLRHLREGDRFNVIQFNSLATPFSPTMLPFSEATLKLADWKIDSLVAEGGTELLKPIVRATEMAPDGLVVLLTDGQVGNEQEILEAALKARKSTRIYSFGIGTNVSDQLLRDLAKQTQGGVEFIHPGERIDEKVTATFAKAIAPRVSDVEVKFVGLETGELAPSTLPPLIDGEPWTLFGRYASASKGHVEIRGKRGNETFVMQVPAELPSRAGASALRSLWASERIADFETQKIQGRRAELMKERITKLAIEFGVSSSYTSFLVVEKREGDRRATGQPETRFIPVSKPAGWDMFGAAPVVAAAAPMAGAVYSAADVSYDAFEEAAPPPNVGLTRSPSPKLASVRAQGRSCGRREWASAEDEGCLRRIRGRSKGGRNPGDGAWDLGHHRSDHAHVAPARLRVMG
jgi:Ca-activated chloride channel family protein